MGYLKHKETEKLKVKTKIYVMQILTKCYFSIQEIQTLI